MPKMFTFLDNHPFKAIDIQNISGPINSPKMTVYVQLILRSSYSILAAPHDRSSIDILRQCRIL